MHKQRETCKYQYDSLYKTKDYLAILCLYQKDKEGMKELGLLFSGTQENEHI
jgi:hypothetical protein